MLKKVLILALIMNVNYTLFSDGLYDVYSKDYGVVVFAVGTAGLTLKSENAGGVYSSMNVGTNTLYSVFAINNNVWSVGEGGTYNFSSDNGVTWSTRNIAGNVTLRSVYFIDSLTGYIAGANGLILKSSYGGNNWVNLSSGTLNNLNKIKFIDQNTGFACGENGTFIKTTNGGAGWVPSVLPAPMQINSFDVLNNSVIAGAENSVLKSTDAGQSWSIIDLKIYSRPRVNSVFFRSDSLFYIALESGSVWYSTDGGTSFKYVLSPYLNEINSIFFIANRAYAVGKNSNAVLRLTGSVWGFPPNTVTSINFTEILSAYGMSFNKIFDINYQKRGVVYVCQQNRLMRSLNMGANWSLLSTLPYERSSQQLLVSRKDSSKMIAALNNMGGFPGDTMKALIYRTTNYGLNWSKVYTAYVDYIGNLMTLDPSHPDTVYLGIRDSVMRSTDFGLTWLKISQGTYEDWCDIAVSHGNSNVLYASTNHYPARISKSTNGGYNWFTVDMVFDTNYCEMPAIAVSNLNPNIIFHAQLGFSNGQTGLKRSYSQGNTWLFNIFAGTSWSVDIAKDDPNVFAYGNVSYSPVYLSVNGGINFIATTNAWAEQIYYYDKANLFITNGSEIYKMSASYNMPVIGVQPISSNVPQKFSLSQNYPNPFNPMTHFEFRIADFGYVRLIIYDALGREIITVVNEQLKPGTYKAEWDASNYPSGIYFYKLETKDFFEAKKMVLIK